jgi:hypothetical protein
MTANPVPYEIGPKAFVASRGVPEPKLRAEFGHKIDPLMRAALAKGLDIGVFASSALMKLDEAHAKHWPRYPREEGEPMFIIDIDSFEPYARELLQGVSKSIHGAEGPASSAAP